MSGGGGARAGAHGRSSRARAGKPSEHANHERWLISYADFITLLFAFFVVMFAVSKVDTKKVGRFQDSFLLAVGVQGNTERGYLPRPDEWLEAISASTLPLPKVDGIKPPPPQNAGAPDFPPELRDLQRLLEERIHLDEQLAGLKIVRRGNDLVLRLDATFLFDSGDDRVKAESLPALNAIAEQVRDHHVQVRVEGHTDDQPIRTLRFRSNWDLSTARATSVVEHLYGKAGIAARRIAAMGYAEFQPLAPNDGSENRAKNRRVDIVLSLDVPLPIERPVLESRMPEDR